MLKYIYIYIYILRSHYFYLFIYSFLLSFSFLRVSLLTTFPSLLSSSIDPQTLLSSSETYCWSAQAQLPQTHRRRPTFGLSSLFSAFWLCVSSCACVSALCFRLCLCFGLGFYFGHGFRFLFRARFVFQTVIFLLFFFSSSLVLMGMAGLWLCNDFYGFDDGWMKYYFIVVFILFYCVKS